ncbi:antibiotic biosynthesis monooxygenase [Shewanella eurypsychrophilus]|uniref:Antibiotic biosynthesis monooxygenase n=1 Tax=Shewanella eurypsychrophilus TaxID=2593656 RepID=A0ABX6VJC4_9GAMM|nr:MULTISPECIES: antibiotic biosynthesis monooxygenase family protein [Shewanella]QFU24982.1 antibiotic biosynthesis monooxygenase [Shewanella sp. YLB-09]QPG60158.1 antibiotic biosynthesis monooxygenase [Shewanella eurypsychrophilus]
MIVRIGEFQAAEGKSEELYEFLQSLSAYITQSKGCVSYDVLRKHEAVKEFAVIERWLSVEDHRASVDSFPKEQMQAAMTLFSGAPKGSYYLS